MRLRFVAQVNPATPEFDRLRDEDEISFVPLEAVWPGLRWDPTAVRPKGAVSNGYTRFREGDVLVPKIHPTFQGDRSTVARRLRSGVAAGTTELHVIRPHLGVDGRYLDYLMSTRDFLHVGEAEMVGVAGQKRVPTDFLLNYEVPTTDPHRQRAIADFLDIETARIDALIAKKNAVKALLVERWNASLDVAIAEGVQRRVKTLTSQITSGPRGWSDRVGDEGASFIRAGNLTASSIEIAGSVVKVNAPRGAESARCRIRSGDTLIGITGANTSWVGLASPEHEGGYVSQHVAIVRPAIVDPVWFAYAMTAPTVRSQLLGGQYGGTKTQLSLNDLGELVVNVPSRDVQARIGREIAAKYSASMATKRALDTQAERLREHRQALITAAVTGQMAVPGVAA